MRISSKAEYACLVVLDLARAAKGDEPVPLRVLSDRKSLPYKYLTQILLQLKAAGIVRSTRGSNGGYTLARPPAEITVWDVIMAVQPEDDTAPRGNDSGRTDLADYCALRRIWDGVLEIERRYLRERSFGDLARAVDDNPQPMFYL
ncbi:MAG: Rrf2 family transcriptional regulator [Planctomycetes bacterium]|nr:Rrf2 family transcriptional regulator [Planctomycetota bacterium]